MNRYYTSILLALLISACATQKSKYATIKKPETKIESKSVSHTFYLIGDAGLSPTGDLNPTLKAFKKRLEMANANSTALFLGDNIYPNGFPNKKDDPKGHTLAKNHLDAQLKTLDDFKGSPLFIPGNHDWYAKGLSGLKREEKYIEKQLGSKDVFMPQNGCPLEVIEIGEDIAIIAIDTEWYLTNWDKNPGINDNCDIKSRSKFLLELEDAIKGNRSRTTVIAMHHPTTSYGSHGGYFSFKQQFYPSENFNVPLPIIGSLVNVLRSTSGVSTTDLNNKRYRDLKNKITTLAQYSSRVIFASGHEHSLQYIVENNTPQIISGSGAKEGATKLLNGSQFSTGKWGYATLEIYGDGASRVRFYGVDKEGKEEFLFTTEVLPPDEMTIKENYPTSFPASTKAAIYSEEQIDKKGFFKTLWGERYRKYYGTDVTAPMVGLDTLYGGLVPVKKGGGHQSKSLRLRDKKGKEYVMRALHKSAEVYLQAIAFQDQYVLDDLKDTYTQGFLEYFYTGSHPYAPFTIGRLSDAVGIFHTNPVLYYVPKQNQLGAYNDVFGDELYMIEEHAGDGHGDLASFGFSDELKSTDAMFEDIRNDEKYMVDTDAYIRARLFDMVIGDWDRHVDQWRWVEFKEGKKIVYRPMPRDRDQAFSIMGDGLFMGLATRLVPGLRLMEGFKEEIRSVKGFNSSPFTYVLDLALLTDSTSEEWLEQANYLKEHLTPNDVDEAFKMFPEEVRDETTDNLKKILLARLAHIEETAMEYYGILNKNAVVTGTDKDDWFEIVRLTKEQTQIKGYRIIKGEKKHKFFDKIFTSDVTKEIWVYGLDDDDTFEVINNKKLGGIKVRLIGGQNNDAYDVDFGRGIVIYDYKSKKNSFEKTNKTRVKRTDTYEVNTYNPLDFKNSTNQLTPNIGFNPDDGFKIGVLNTYTYNGFRQNPFSQQHTFNAAYYFATNGLEFGYAGEFAHIFENWNMEIKTRFTTPQFAINFFGFGNNTENRDDDLDLDYNRARFQYFEFAPSLVKRGEMGSQIKLGVSYESIEVEESENRFIADFYQNNGAETNNSFLGVHGTYSYENYDNSGFPTVGMATSLDTGYKNNVEEGGGFGYVVPSISLVHKLVPSGNVVLAAKWKAHFNIGDDYEFYQAASIGGIDGLRGFRNQRFAGKTSYYQNTDIRFSLKKRRTAIVPASMGLFAGFDYGKVWYPNISSNQWHTSYGGGLFLNASEIIAVNLALFQSDDGPRFVFGLGFGF